MRVAVVGAGISGLACAVALRQKGIDFLLLEKDRACGGKLRTEKLDGFTVEAGPDSFLPEKHWTVDLIRQIGLADELLATNEEHKGTYIYSAGRLHRLPEGVMLMVPTMVMPILRSGLISCPGKVRMALELVVPRKRDDADESLASFVQRRLGRECLEKIAEPLVAGIHTSDPDDMSVKAVFPRFVEMERRSGSLIRAMARAMRRPKAKAPGPAMTYFMSLKEGMGQLADRCAAFLGPERIRTSCEVTGIERTDKGYAVLSGADRSVFDAVVLTTPSYVTARIVGDAAPVLAARLSQIEWSSTATVSAAFRQEDVKADLPGFGFIVPRAEERRINAATWSSIKWSHRAPPGFLLVRAFVGGAGRADLLDHDDAALSRIVGEELREIAGIQAKPLFTRVYRWHRSMPRYTVGHLDRVAAADEAARALPGLYLAGASLYGIGIGDCVHSGFEAAERIMASGRRDERSRPN